VREFLQKNPVVVVIIAGALLVAALFVIVRRVATPRYLKSVYYYDLKTGDLFNGSIHDIPPIDAPAGGPGQGVQAHVFACGSCDKDDRFAAFITTLPEKAHQTLAAEQPPSFDQSTFIEMNTLIALPPRSGESPKWITRHSAEGEQIAANAASEKCAGRAAAPCRP